MAITDLTGYKWIGNDSVSITSDKTYDIQGLVENSDGSSVTGTSFEFKRFTTTNQYSGLTEYVSALEIDGTTYSDGVVGSCPQPYYMNNSSSYPTTCNKLGGNTPYFTSITFTDGTDLTNAELITWLEANGTLTEPEIVELTPFLTSIANAIRAKKGTTATINAQNFASEIESIETGGSSNWTEEPRYSGQVIMENVGYGSGILDYFHYDYVNFQRITLTSNGTTDIPATNMAYISLEGVLTEIRNTNNVEVLRVGTGTPLKIVLQPKAENWSISLWSED